MDWHPVISVQQQTPDVCHFSISNVRFAFWAFFRKPEKLGSHTGSKWCPGDPDVKDDPNDQLTRWPNDPVPRLVRSRPACGASELCTRSPHHSKGHFWRVDGDAAWSQLQWPVVLFTARRNMQRKCNMTWLPVSLVCTVWEAGAVSKRMGGSRWFSTRGQRWR